MLPALTFESCNEASCSITFEGETNYTFGASERRGFCSIDVDAFFTSATDAFGYVEVADSDKNEAGAGEFANFCRVDLRRDGDEVQLSLRGTGCALNCHEVPDPVLSGLYKPAGSPSFRCGDDLTVLNWVEQNLCMDSELAALDREMARPCGRPQARTSERRDSTDSEPARMAGRTRVVRSGSPV